MVKIMYSLTTTLYVIQQRNSRGVVSLCPNTRTDQPGRAELTLSRLREAQRSRPEGQRLTYRLLRVQAVGGWA